MLKFLWPFKDYRNKMANNCQSRKRPSLDEDERSECDALRTELDAFKNLLKSRNLQLLNLYEQLKISKEETKASQEETRVAKNSINSLKDEIVRGLYQIIKRIEKFPDIFTCTTGWKNYTDIKFLRQIRLWGGARYCRFFQISWIEQL